MPSQCGTICSLQQIKFKLARFRGHEDFHKLVVRFLEKESSGLGKNWEETILPSDF